MNKPMIGITPQINEEGDYLCREHYIKCIMQAGGIPVILPLEESVDQTVEFCDGFLLSGGPDFHPNLFKEEKLKCCGNINSKRDMYELALIPAVLARKKPILGICRGIQALNVSLGGTLYQDLPTQKPSSVCHSMSVVNDDVIHSVDIIDGTPLNSLLKTNQTMVNSYHHQSIKNLGRGLEVSAVAADGVIEGVFLRDYPFCQGVQWHPERLKNTDSFYIFASLISAAKRY